MAVVFVDSYLNF